MKGFALGLTVKARDLRTRKWPIDATLSFFEIGNYTHKVPKDKARLFAIYIDRPAMEDRPRSTYQMNIITWPIGFQDKLLYLVYLFSLYPSLFGNCGTKESLKILSRKP